MKTAGRSGCTCRARSRKEKLDHQRKFINERMETAHAKVEDYRAQASMKAEKKALAGNIVRWVEKIGEGIDNLPPEDLGEVLRLVVDEIVIDRDNHVTITMGIPTDGLMSIDKEVSQSPYNCNTAAPTNPRAPRSFAQKNSAPSALSAVKTSPPPLDLTRRNY